MKVKGPLHSIDASGTFAKVLTFSKNQRANFAYFKPNVARVVYSPLQDPLNKCLFNSAYWLFHNVLTPEQRQYWHDLNGAGNGLIKFFWYNAGALELGEPVRSRKDELTEYIEDPTQNPYIFYADWTLPEGFRAIMFTDNEPENQRGHYRQYIFKARFVPSFWPPGDPVPPEYFTDWTVEKEFNCPCDNFTSFWETTGFLNFMHDQLFFPANQYFLITAEAITCTGNPANIPYYIYFNYPNKGIYYHFYEA